jgi:hypothetical protein
MNNLARVYLLWKIAGKVLPFVGGLILAVLHAVAIAIIAMWRDVPKVIEDIAVEWQEEALHKEWAASYDRFIYWFFYVVAWVCFLVGWLISAWVSLFLFRSIIF